MEALNRLGNALRHLGRHDEATAAHQRVLEMAQAGASSRDEGNAYAGLGRIALARRRYPQAAEQLRQAAYLLRTTGAAEAEGVAREAALATHLSRSRISRALKRHAGLPGNHWEFA